MNLIKNHHVGFTNNIKISNNALIGSYSYLSNFFSFAKIRAYIFSWYAI